MDISVESEMQFSKVIQSLGLTLVYLFLPIYKI